MQVACIQHHRLKYVDYCFLILPIMFCSHRDNVKTFVLVIVLFGTSHMCAVSFYSF